MQLKNTDKQLTSLTNEELTIKVGELTQALDSALTRLRTAEDQLIDLITYSQELESVTFIALYLWTGKFKKSDIGAISERRITQANALRINGRRSLGEYREKQHVKEVHEAADKLEIYYDDNTPLENLEKQVSSEFARIASREEQKKREEKEMEDAGTTDNTSR